MVARRIYSRAAAGENGELSVFAFLSMSRLWVIAFCLAAPSSASAGAFMQPEGGGQIIAQVGFSKAGYGYDAFGRPVAIRAWRKVEVSAWGEYGLTDAVTLIGEPSWRSFRADKLTDWNGFEVGRAHVARLGATQIGARVKLLEWENSILSAQATARFAPGGKEIALYSDMRRPMQADIRLLYGRRLEAFGLKGFASAEFGFRNDGAFGHQFRMDLTYGLQVWDRLTLMLQNFTILTPRWFGGQFAVSQKAQASLVFAVTDAVSVQVGAMMGLRGANSAAERGLVSAVWTRF